MPAYEYLSVPAPKKGEKAKGVKGSNGRMAQAMTTLLNTHGAEGWEYVRSDTLPMEERSGLTSKSVSYYTVLVFRRPLAEVTGNLYPTDEINAAVAEAEARAAAAVETQEVIDDQLNADVAEDTDVKSPLRASRDD